MSISIFGFQALWSPYFLAALIVVTTLYYMFLAKQKDDVSRKQQVCFLTAVVLLYIVKGSPLDLLGHIMFSAHMTQMAILYLVIPPLFIIGIPDWLWRSLININVIRPVFHFFTRPLIALIVFNCFFSFYHIPFIFDFVKTNIWLHAGYTSLLFLTAVWMWFPLVNRLQERESLTGVKKIAYIFASGILMTPACALIIFASDPLYETYSDASSWAKAMELCVPATSLASFNISGPEMFNGLPLMEDQQLGGVLMKIIQELVLGVVLGYIFFTWYRKENGVEEEIDPVPGHYTTIK